jgi:PGF-CTERM protein
LKKIAVICILAVISAATIFPVYAQSNGQSSQNGMIIGHVIGPNGQSVAGVEISYFIEDAVKANRASGSRITTDSNGDYTIRFAMMPSDLAANIGKLYITAKFGHQTLMRGGPTDSIEIKGGTAIRVDFHFGALGQPPVIVISNSPNTLTAEGFASTSSAQSSLTSRIPTNSSMNQSSLNGNINISENKRDCNTAVKSSTPGFEVILTLAGLITAGYILRRKM